MRAMNVVRLLPIFLILVAGVGCENPQEMINTIKAEKEAVVKQLAEATEKADKLASENEMLQSGVEAAKAAAAKVAEATKQAKAAATAAIADAKKGATEAASKAIADVKAKLAGSEAASKKAISAVDGKLAAVQKQLAAANAKIAGLEADLKKATAEKESP